MRRKDGTANREPTATFGTATSTCTNTVVPTSNTSHCPSTPDAAYAALSHTTPDPVTAVTLCVLPESLNAVLSNTTSCACTADWSECATVVVYVTVPPGHITAVGGDTNGGCNCGCTAVSTAGVAPATMSTCIAVTRASGSTSNTPVDDKVSNAPTRVDAMICTNPVVAVHVSVHSGTLTAVPSVVAIIGKKNSGPHEDVTPPLPSTKNTTGAVEATTDGSSCSRTAAVSSTPLSMRKTAVMATCWPGTTVGKLSLPDDTSSCSVGLRTNTDGTAIWVTVKLRLVGRVGMVPYDTSGRREIRRPSGPGSTAYDHATDTDWPGSMRCTVSTVVGSPSASSCTSGVVTLTFTTRT